MSSLNSFVDTVTRKVITMPHAVHVKPICKDIRCEVLYQNTPSFANEDLSALIRIRHTGTPNVKEQISTTQDSTLPAEITTRSQTEDTSDPEGGWFGRRLSVSLTNSARNFFVEQESTTTSSGPIKKPTNLLSGYVQLSGWFHYDPSTISDEKLQEFKQRTKISGKFGGLEGMQVSQTERNNSVYGMLSRGVNDLFNTKMNDLHDKLGGATLNGSMSNSCLLEKVPFFSSTQSLLFGEINMNPGELKQFLFDAKLPAFLPSSYEGSAVAIRYELIVGMYVDQESIVGPPMAKIHKFPLAVNSVFDTEGYQPVSKIDQFFLLSANNPHVNEIQGQKERRRSSIAGFKKRLLNGEELTPQYKRSEILKKIKLLAELDDKEDLNYDFMNEIETLLNLDSRQSIQRFIEKVQSLPPYNRGTSNSDSVLQPKMIDGVQFVPILSSLIESPKRKYQMSHNSNPLISLTFNKPLYKISETIKLQIQFLSSSRPLGLLITLDSLELINSSYASDSSSVKSNPPKTTHFKRNLNLTQSSNFLSIDLPIPKATHSFKTNIFEHRWSIGLKLIMASPGTEQDPNKNALQLVVFEDQVGKFISAAPDLIGWEFGVVRVPVVVLP